MVKPEAEEAVYGVTGGNHGDRSIFDPALASMLREYGGENSYYYSILSYIPLLATDKTSSGIPITTACLEWEVGRRLFTIRVNPGFYSKYNILAQVDILKHEVRHFIYDHIHRSMQVKHKELANVAQDVIINQGLKYLLAALPGIPSFEGLNKEGILFNKETEVLGWEDVYAALVKRSVNRSKIGASFDIHLPNIPWEEGKGGAAGEDPQAIYKDAVIKQVLNKAVRDTKDREGLSAGNVPGHIQMVLNELNTSKRNWRKDMAIFPARINKALRGFSRKKRNRRFGLLYPGCTKDFDKRLMVGVDLSGSMSDEFVAQAFSEIDKMHKQGVQVVVVTCDTEVRDVWEYTGPRSIKITGRGGTMFNPVFEEAKKHEIDGLIYLTDGECFDTVEKPRFPVMWALMPGCDIKLGWGYKVWVEFPK